MRAADFLCRLNKASDTTPLERTKIADIANEYLLLYMAQLDNLGVRFKNDHFNHVYRDSLADMATAVARVKKEILTTSGVVIRSAGP